MARDTLTGSRIRERRIILGLKQAELAKRAEISPSYLNLIEHNRRRIGGRLLVDIARILEVEPSVLTEGAEAALIGALREVASGPLGATAELDRVDEFAGRFPGWAALLARSQRRIQSLERAVETLSDRLTHDPQLAASLHEMLSRVTAIRSAASILAEPGDISPEWQGRFHRNIYEDSDQLAETSRALVAYLEAADEDTGSSATAPQEELDAILEEAQFRFPMLESEAQPIHAAPSDPSGRAAQDGPSQPARLAATLTQSGSEAARMLLTEHLTRYARDAAALPRARLIEALAETGPDPVALAAALGQGVALVMRRLAMLDPENAGGDGPGGFGLAICDSSGVLTFRKPLADFPMPRFGAGCPLWPLYAALNRPGAPISAPLLQPGEPPRPIRAYAIAEQVGPPRLDRAPLYEATMLVAPTSEAFVPEALPVGVNCRICPRRGCEGRREPSILGRDPREEF
ncbi:Helix-turn-helix domain protein [Roseivivax sp. THAF40]|uniref:helix-turn-helix domain-containing protein n=1 Tax=unclassified Roseivivax TaxID=2639302 RepID=UPI001268EB51|nr:MULTISPECIES: helix-turn-helix domain-containing protein [unclassified Roseivivax]QFS83805.1 Helix-turn-helix domain protein [Roseivivax sp. THAF197b]QFT47637.1 Helix-turn-helix domain protein [Roseivivax sp. THAF40]